MPEDEANGESTNEEQALDFGTALEPADQVSVPFMGEEALAARLEGLGIYVTVKSICQMIGVRYDRQYDRIRRSPNLAKHSRLIKIQTRGGPQSMLCMKVSRLGTWLDSIQTSSVRNERSRQIIESLQDEFAVVTNEVFMRRLGVDATALMHLPDDPSTRELARQYNELLDIVTLMREHLYDISATVGPLPEKLDQVVLMLQKFFAIQQEHGTQISKINERTQKLTPAHARTVQEFITSIVQHTQHAPTPLTYSIIYGRLKHKFRVGSYSEAPDERFDELMTYLKEELRKATEGTLPEQGNLF